MIAYESFAPVYDDFTAHHDYELWFGNLLPKVEAHGLRKGSLLDVACGTGKSLLPLLERGWEVTGCDISPAMIEVARGKTGDRVEFVVADMRELPKLGEFDLVICPGDAVNYMHGTAELEAALRGMRENMKPDGKLVFDANTINALRTFWSETTMVEHGGVRLTWLGLTDPLVEPGQFAEARLQVEPLERDAPRVEPQVHRERHFTEAEVLAALERAGLECLDVWGHHYDAIPHQPLDEEADIKGIYIAGRG
ncbi:MAG TPA: methyltransferase domain-containing protein [Solirubrobacterales bacterium]|jgi:SAM-dependent methyltransferase|nr:methyltransferase domain-containing protein [Solirubrobacterales bacterium]